ncbi:MAG: immunoglobulin domain-containing protein [Verrucomicrobiales bacterium]|nr:immunoglobulin domain-containing protein [Verrucomicrobiales bacterium]
MLNAKDGHLHVLTSEGNLLRYAADSNGGLTFESSLNCALTPEFIAGTDQIASVADRIFVAGIRTPLTIIRTNDRPGVLITSQPMTGPLALDRGARLELSVQAESRSQIRYQWMRDLVTLPLRTNEVFTVDEVHRQDAGRYSVIVSTDGGSMLSRGTRVGINVPLKLLSPVRRPDGEVEIPFIADDGEVLGNLHETWFTLQSTEDPSVGNWWSLQLGAAAWVSRFDEGMWRVQVPHVLFEPVLTPPWLPAPPPRTKWFFRLQSQLIFVW